MVLRLPSNYVEVESDEMEYIDGGGWLFELTLGVAGSILGGLISQAFGINVSKGCALRAIKALGGWAYNTFLADVTLMEAAPYIGLSILCGVVLVTGYFIIRNGNNYPH